MCLPARWSLPRVSPASSSPRPSRASRPAGSPPLAFLPGGRQNRWSRVGRGFARRGERSATRSPSSGACRQTLEKGRVATEWRRDRPGTARAPWPRGGEAGAPGAGGPSPAPGAWRSTRPARAERHATDVPRRRRQRGRPPGPAGADGRGTERPPRARPAPSRRAVGRQSAPSGAAVGEAGARRPLWSPEWRPGPLREGTGGGCGLTSSGPVDGGSSVVDGSGSLGRDANRSRSSSVSAISAGARSSARRSSMTARASCPSRR